MSGSYWDLIIIFGLSRRTARIDVKRQIEIITVVLHALLFIRSITDASPYI